MPKKVFPIWIEDLFLKLSYRYQQLWEDVVSTPTAELIQKQIYLTALSRFKPETVSAATDLMMARHQYPDLSHIVKYAEEISQSCKVPEYQCIEYKPESTPESRREADQARAEIRAKLGIKK